MLVTAKSTKSSGDKQFPSHFDTSHDLGVRKFAMRCRVTSTSEFLHSCGPIEINLDGSFLPWYSSRSFDSERLYRVYVSAADWWQIPTTSVIDPPCRRLKSRWNNGSKPRLDNTEPKSLEAKPLVRFSRCDLTSAAIVEGVADNVKKDFGNPTLLINNADIPGSSWLTSWVQDLMQILARWVW